MLYFAAGVVVGTFIPMPQQKMVRDAAIFVWNTAKAKAALLKSGL